MLHIQGEWARFDAGGGQERSAGVSVKGAEEPGKVLQCPLGDLLPQRLLFWHGLIRWVPIRRTIAGSSHYVPG